MAAGPQEARQRRAMGSFWRLLAYLGIAGIAMVAAALYYLSRNGPMTATLVIATTIGVFVSIVLGGGLMAAGFLSSNSGHDERAAGVVQRPPKAKK